MFTVTYSIPWNIKMPMYLFERFNGYLVITWILLISQMCLLIRFVFWSDLSFDQICLLIRFAFCKQIRCPGRLHRPLCPTWENQSYISHLAKPILYFLGKTDIIFLETWIHHQSSCEGMDFQPVHRYSWSLWTPLGHLRMDIVKKWNWNTSL